MHWKSGCVLYKFGFASWCCDNVWVCINVWAATSKFYQLADMDAASGCFGFRGEALASISDVSLLEIVTKAYGRPNGYRKVIKVWAFHYCLSFAIPGASCLILLLFVQAWLRLTFALFCVGMQVFISWNWWWYEECRHHR